MNRLIAAQPHATHEFIRLFVEAMFKHRKRGNRHLPPLGIVKSWRMAQCGRAIVLGPPYRRLRWMGSFCVLAAVLAGCAATAPTTSGTPISAYANLIISEATSLHQLELALAALQQAPTVVMQPTPVIVTPNPVTQPPVTITPVVPGAPVPPVVGGGGGPIVTPSLQRRRHAIRQFDDNPPASAAALNAAQLSQLTLAAVQ